MTDGDESDPDAEVGVCADEIGTFTDSRDGQSYKTVTIDGQTWMAENLNYETGESWCWLDEPSNCDIYGRLYEWETVMDGAASTDTDPSGVQGICPAGWHVPSDEEWKALEMALGMSRTEADGDGYRGTNEGSKMAAHPPEGPLYWHENSELAQDPEFCTSGFLAFPSGAKGPNCFLDHGPGAYWWTATEGRDERKAWYRHLRARFTEVYRYDNWYKTNHGFALRCVKD